MLKFSRTVSRDFFFSLPNIYESTKERQLRRSGDNVKNCHFGVYNPFSIDKFSTLPNSKTLQTTTLNSMKMTESSVKGVENTVGKEEIAHDEQFLLFPLCFQKPCTTRLVWERLKYTFVFSSAVYGENPEVLLWS